MPTAWETFPIKFEGGLISNLGRLEHGLQAPGSATVLKNFEPSIEGGYKKILGYTKAISATVPGAGQVIGAIIATLTKTIAVRGEHFYLWNGSAWVDKLTAASIGASTIRHDHFNFTGEEQIVIVDGLNKPIFYNTITDTMAYDDTANTDVIGATIVKVFKNHVFFAKNNLLVFTAPYDPTNYETGDGAGVINIGAKITGLVVFRDELIIFATDRILRLSGGSSEDFVLNPIADKTGCLSPDTIQEVGGDILYLGPDGVRFLSATLKNNDFSLERASQNIQDKITDLVENGGRWTSVVLRGKSQYRIFVARADISPKFSLGYLATRFADQSATGISWSEIVGFKPYSIDSRQYEEDEVILFSSDDGYIYRMENSFAFDGQPIECIFETPFMPITDPRKRKTLYKHSLYATVGATFSLDAGIKIDYRRSDIIQPNEFNINGGSGGGSLYGGSIYGSAIYSGSINFARDLFIQPIVGSGFTFALRYAENSINPSFILDYAILEFREQERR